ncbi:hypothetical protein Lal_00000312 [Lupinus albus]|nr:hypothetical protein Lal_00000312 [Lupinus albus]
MARGIEPEKELDRRVNVRRGVEHGSTVKFHDARHDPGLIEEGFIEDLNAFKAAISDLEVTACAMKMLLSKTERQHCRFGVARFQILFLTV